MRDCNVVSTARVENHLSWGGWSQGTHLWNVRWTPAPACLLGRRSSCPAPPSDACSSPCREKPRHLHARVGELSGGVSCEVTHMMFSTDLGLMKMAMGWSWASWSLLMALPDTSRMQCLPWKQQENISNHTPPLEWGQSGVKGQRGVSPLPSPPPPGPTARWSRTGGCCIAPPRWTCGPGCPSPFALWRSRSDSLCRPPRSPASAGSCLRAGSALNIRWHERTTQPLFTGVRRTYEGRRIRTCRGTLRSGRRWCGPSWGRGWWRGGCSSLWDRIEACRICRNTWVLPVVIRLL